jgi:hypothetical protein
MRMACRHTDAGARITEKGSRLEQRCIEARLAGTQEDFPKKGILPLIGIAIDSSILGQPEQLVQSERSL